MVILKIKMVFSRYLIDKNVYTISFPIEIFKGA